MSVLLPIIFSLIEVALMALPVVLFGVVGLAALMTAMGMLIG